MDRLRSQNLNSMPEESTVCKKQTGGRKPHCMYYLHQHKLLITVHRYTIILKQILIQHHMQTFVISYPVLRHILLLRKYRTINDLWYMIHFTKKYCNKRCNNQNFKGAAAALNA